MAQKPKGALKQFLDTTKKESRVLGKLERHFLATPRIKDRRTDVLHPSEMAKDSWCYRASYFHLMGFEPASAKRKLSMQTDGVFEEGHAIHHKWQKRFKNMNAIYGLWECRECDESFWGMPGDHNGNPDGVVYKEVPLDYPQMRIAGHADGWLTEFGDPLLLEIKSVGEGTIRWEDPSMLYKYDGDFKKVWANLESPFQSHIMQAQIYMKLIELIGFDQQAPQEACFIYESKPTQEYKEFIIPKSDFGITEKFDAAQMIVDAVGKGTPPVCNIGGPELCSSCKEYK